MTHQRRPDLPGPVGVCPTAGKRQYRSRKVAKQVSNRLHGDRCNAYRCPCGYWHLGHLPGAVIAGTISRTDIASNRVHLGPTGQEAC